MVILNVTWSKYAIISHIINFGLYKKNVSYILLKYNIRTSSTYRKYQLLHCNIDSKLFKMI